MCGVVCSECKGPVTYSLLRSDDACADNECFDFEIDILDKKYH